MRVVGWRWQEREPSLAGELELLGYLEHDRYRGPVLRLVDSRPWGGTGEPAGESRD